SPARRLGKLQSPYGLLPFPQPPRSSHPSPSSRPPSSISASPPSTVNYVTPTVSPSLAERGQYTSIAFGLRCREAGVRPSMGSVGDAYDNAMCESFFATLECELLDRNRFRTQAEARIAVFQFIEGWYNPHRRHSGLGNLSPAEFERCASVDSITASTSDNHRIVDIEAALTERGGHAPLDWMKWLATSLTRSRYHGASIKRGQSRRKRRKPAMEHIAIDLGAKESQ